MLKIPSRYSHLAYGVIQTGFTCSISAAIANLPFANQGMFLQHWLRTWGISWLTMVPIVVLAAPLIRRIVDRITSHRQT